MKERNMKRPKVSIVVPIYNVEKYLDECLTSITKQTLREIEIIAIDDGSTDTSGKILDTFATKDKRIKVIHQENSGYSAAVNLGISLSIGDYVGIVESDDMVDVSMYENLFNKAIKNNADIAKCQFYKFNPFSRKNPLPVYKNPGGVDLELAPELFAPEDWPAIIAFHASIWSSIYKRTLIQQNPIPDTPGASYQDLPFMLKVVTAAKKITIVKKPLYYWRNEPGQTHSTSVNGERALLMAKNTLLGLKILKDSGKYDSMRDGFFAQAYWTNIAFFSRIQPQYRQQYFVLLKKIFSDLDEKSLAGCKYLRSEDKFAISQILHKKNWRALYVAYSLGRVKRFLLRV